MSFKKKVMEGGMRLMTHPRVMGLMSNPKVMNVVMKAFQLRSTAQAALDEKVKIIARMLNLATREDLRDLKAALQRMQDALDKREGSE